MPSIQKASVIEISMKNANTKEIVFRSFENFSFIPGQYITILIPTPDGKQLGRSYSIASQKQENTITLVVRIVSGGLGSTYLDHLCVEDTISFLGPLGHFCLANDIDKDYIFVATGTGIAPFIPMIYSLLGKTDKNILLLTGARNEEDAIYSFSAWGGTYPHFQWVHMLSRPSEIWQGERGRVTDYLIAHSELFQNSQIYVCGNGSMVKDVVALAKQHVVAEELIFFEKYNNL